jgi:hypothetical protein
MGCSVCEENELTYTFTINNETYKLCSDCRDKMIFLMEEFVSGNITVNWYEEEND